MPKLWDVKFFQPEDIYKNLIENKTFKIPTYQRTLVWSDEQKETFLDSLKKGYPFGSLLLFNDKKNGYYQVIDGLQRCRTISEFIENPTAFFNNDDIDFETLESIFKLSKLNGNKEIIIGKMAEILEDWIKEDYKTMDQVNGIQYIEYAYKLSSEIAVFKGIEKEISERIKPSIQKFIKICKSLLESSIPAIIIEPEQEKALPIIFDRINSQGTQLSKYQIYAAKWAYSSFRLDNSELSQGIIDLVKKMYDKRISQGYEIEGYNPIELDQKRELNFFDLLFGFGQKITRDFPYIFQNTNVQSDTVVSSAFTLVNACLGLKSNELDDLLNNYDKKLDKDDINVFLKEIYQAISFLDTKVLKTITRFKSNKRESYSILHSDNQIISMITAIFVAKHGKILTIRNQNKEEQTLQLSLNQTNEDWVQKQSLFGKNMLKYYMSDIISSKWKGSGDSFLHQLIFNPDRYTKEFAWSEFEFILDSYFFKLNEERNERSKVLSPKSAEKIILKAVYLDKFSAKDQFNDSRYDIEHLATKKLMINACQDLDISLPISSIGNLCLLPEYENRTKKDKILYKDNQYINAINEDKLKYIEDKFTFTSREDFVFLEDLSNPNKSVDAEEFKKEYFKFLSLRFQRIKNNIKSNIFD